MPVFGESQKKKKGAPIINEIVGRVNDNTKRLRLLEQRERLLTSRIGSLDVSMAQKVKDIDGSITELDTKLTANAEALASLDNRVKEVIKQLKFLANRTEIKKIEEKLKILEPLLMQVASSGEPKQQQ